ncbi:hypothetical protein [Streptomyces sp. NPDC055632]
MNSRFVGVLAGFGAPRMMKYGTSRAGAVQVPLHRTAAVDALPDAHPEAGWEELRQVGEGRRSPLAALRPETETKAVSGPA